MFSIDKTELFQAILQQFGDLPNSTRQQFDSLTDSDDLEILRDDLPLCADLRALQDVLSWLCGRQDGRIDGLRRAVTELLNFRDDEAAQEIDARAFVSSDPDELVELLLHASSLANEISISRN